MDKVRIDVQGASPLLMHAATLADPLDEATKAFKTVSGKRSKTEDDHIAMSRMEFAAGLYLAQDGYPVMPAANLMACLIAGARITKSGPKVERGMTLLGVEFPLIYTGPKTAAELFADPNFVDRRSVVNQRARVMRTRPKFREWGFTAEGYVDAGILDVPTLTAIAADAGNLIGLGDYRKGGGFGRFTAKVSAL
jgi:hypothetical protein